MDSPRTLLDSAAQQRERIQLRSRSGDWVLGRVVRVERAGVVVTLDTPSFNGGEDVHAWISVDGVAYTFSASILRVDVPVPDRSQGGLLLGYLDAFQQGRPEPRPASAASAQIEVLPALGRGLRLLGGDIHLVELSVTQLAFAVPARIALKFVEGGSVRVRMSTGQGEPHVVDARITRRVGGEGHYLYGLEFTQVVDAERHLQVVSELRG